MIHFGIFRSFHVDFTGISLPGIYFIACGMGGSSEWSRPGRSVPPAAAWTDRVAGSALTGPIPQPRLA